MLGLVLTFLAVGLVAFLILRKFHPILVFLLAGSIISLILVAFMGYQPMGDQSTGSRWLDIFASLGQELKDQLSGAGIRIMLVSGYAGLMNQVGAAGQLARKASQPLMRLDKPYLILALLYVVGVGLKLMITSHSGLVILLMATFYPILVQIGVSRLSAASAILLSGALDWGVNDGAVIFAAENVSQVGVGDYFIHYQLLPVLITVLVMALVMGFYFKHLDQQRNISSDPGTTQVDKDLKSSQSAGDPVGPDRQTVPFLYTFLPGLPLAIVLLSLLIPGWEVDVVVANLIGLMVTLVFEFVLAKRSFNQVADSLNYLLDQMGKSFANVVSLIVVASFFADSLIQLGGIETLSQWLSHLQGAPLIALLVLSGVCLLTVMVLGSGNAGWFTFGSLIKEIGPQVGLQSFQLGVPMQLASSMGRCLSPVSGAMIAVAGMAQLEMEDLMKRNLLPVLLGLLTQVVVSYLVHV